MNIVGICISFVALLTLVNGAAKKAGYIINGKNATTGQFPWQASLLFTKNTGSSSLCGGSLIHQQWILTAAHCVVNVTKVQVRLGTTTYNVGPAHTITAAAQIIKHPNHNPTNKNNDLALIKLNAPVTLNATVNIIKLIAPTATLAQLTASGWGKICDTCTTYPTTLVHANVTAIPNANCSAVYGPAIVTANTLCTTGIKGTSTCQGDSGGPLIQVGSPASNSRLAGVTSFTAGSAGCQAGLPAGFVRVANYCAWLKTFIPTLSCV